LAYTKIITSILSCYGIVPLFALTIFISEVMSSAASVPLLPLDTKYIETLKAAYILSLLLQFFSLKNDLLHVTHNHLLSYGVENHPERSYYGGPTHECPYCGAVFWFQECVKSASTVVKRKTVYNLCCRGGKINLKTYRNHQNLCVACCGLMVMHDQSNSCVRFDLTIPSLLSPLWAQLLIG
jgi:hypothetical protein